MDEGDFDDLFGGGGSSAGSSSESLTTAAANSMLRESHDISVLADCRPSLHTGYPIASKPPTQCSSPTVKTVEAGDALLQQAHQRPCAKSKASPSEALGSNDDNVQQGVSVIQRIERVFERIADDLQSDAKDIGLTLRVRARPSTSQQLVSGEGACEVKTKHVCFPGKTAAEAWRFAVVVRILELMHTTLRTGVVISKRFGPIDIYYRDPALFGSQSAVDRYVDDVAFTFGVPRSALNVAAVAKGLVVGAINFCRRDGSIVNAATDKDGLLVPSLKEVLSVNMKAVKWIVVIEKEASFRAIAGSRFWDRLCTEGVLITGKGYPDIATRAMLRFLSTPSPRNSFAAPPVYGLADFDPDGLAILSVYAHGSVALAHESAELRVPQLKWLGLKGRHMGLGSDSTHASQGLLTLTARDRSKAQKMLAQRESPADPGDTEVRRELQIMLMLNVKAELQLLDAIPDGLATLLQGALSSLGSKQEN